MQRWLMMALLKRTFSGQSDTVLRSVRQAIQASSNGFPIQAIINELKGSPKDMTFNDAEIDALFDYRYHQSYTFTVLAMLYPWLKYDQHFHIDHIFPQSMFTERELEKRGIPHAEWGRWLDYKDVMANLQLLQGLPNQEKSDKEFEAWLQEINPAPADLADYRQSHMIPEGDLSFNNFPNFLKRVKGC